MMNGGNYRFSALNGARIRRLGIALAGAAACVIPSVASANTVATTTGTARAIVLTNLSLVKVRDMDFGDLIVTTGGTVLLNPTTSACSVSGGLVKYSTCQAAIFGGRGANGGIVRVRVQSNSISLTGPGAPMVLDNFTIAGASNFVYVGPGQGFVRHRINNSSGVFNFMVGGLLHVNSGQRPGTYTGTFDVRIDYQ